MSERQHNLIDVKKYNNFYDEVKNVPSDEFKKIIDYIIKMGHLLWWYMR